MNKNEIPYAREFWLHSPNSEVVLAVVLAVIALGIALYAVNKSR